MLCVKSSWTDPPHSLIKMRWTGYAVSINQTVYGERGVTREEDGQGVRAWAKGRRGHCLRASIGPGWTRGIHPGSARGSDREAARRTAWAGSAASLDAPSTRARRIDAAGLPGPADRSIGGRRKRPGRVGHRSRHSHRNRPKRAGRPPGRTGRPAQARRIDGLQSPDGPT